jgi:hypothetical protein
MNSTTLVKEIYLKGDKIRELKTFNTNKKLLEREIKLLMFYKKIYLLGNI